MGESDKTGFQYRSNVNNNGRIQEIIKWGMAAAVMEFCHKHDYVSPTMCQLDYFRVKSIAKFVDTAIDWLSK